MKARARQALPAAGVRANVEALTPAPLPVGEGCKVESARCALPLIPSPLGRGWRAAPGEGLSAPHLAPSSSRARASDSLTPAPLPGGEGCKVESARCALPLIPSPTRRGWRAAPGEGVSAPRLAPSSSRARASDALTPAPLPGERGAKSKAPAAPYRLSPLPPGEGGAQRRVRESQRRIWLHPRAALEPQTPSPLPLSRWEREWAGELRHERTRDPCGGGAVVAGAG